MKWILTEAKQFALMLAVVAAPLIAVPNAVQAGTSWATTWSASPQPAWDEDFPFPNLLPYNLWNQTIRQVARIGLGGDKFRVVISNEFGEDALDLAGVNIALANEGSSIDPASDTAVTFSGSKTLSIPPGASAMSDIVAFEAAPLTELAVSIFVETAQPVRTFHWDGVQTAYIGSGNQTSAANISEASETTVRMFLTDILVEAEDGVRTVVTFGDSITDGNASGLDQNARYPDHLAARLAVDNIAVVNAGISGRRLLFDRMGLNAVAAFDEEVLSHPNVSSVVVMIGINDIGWPNTILDNDNEVPTAEEFIFAYRQLIAHARVHGVRIIGATLTPYKGALSGTPFADYYSEAGNELRKELNEWMRTSGEFDAVADFDMLLRDPDNPDLIKAEYDSGDKLHPGADGYKAMAEALTHEILFGNQ